MGLTQAEFATKTGMSGNSIARMERGEMIITKPMALLIAYVAREPGGERSHGQTGRRAAAAQKRPHRKTARNSIRESRQRPRRDSVPPRGR